MVFPSRLISSNHYRGVGTGPAGPAATRPILRQNGQVYSTEKGRRTNISSKRRSLFNRKASVPAIARTHCAKNVISVSTSSWAGT